MNGGISLVEVIGYLTAFFVFGLGALILWKVFTGQIDLTYLVSEPDKKASLSRFQFLIFTFVIAGVFLSLSIKAGTIVEIPNNVLILMGISSGSYVVSKGIAANVAKTDTDTQVKGAPDNSDVSKVDG